MEEKPIKKNNELKFDFLIVGSGLAGLYAALYASKFGKIALLTKSTLEESNSYWAQGGIAAAIDPEDSPVFHLKDTLVAGRGLCNEEAVRILVDEGRDRILKLIAFGMKFDSGEKGLELGLEGGHTKRRVLHAGGSSTGKQMVQFLIAAVKENLNIAVFERYTVASLISDGDRCFGALAWRDQPFEETVFLSKVTVLCAGGASALYDRTTNPPSAVGEGIALAYRAGAEVTDMEFIQFHPTALYTKDGGTFLVSEAVRGEGAYLLNHNEERFMKEYHELYELAPRDVVSQAIFNEMRKSGKDCVFLTLRHLDSYYIKKRFSNIYEACLNFGVDITEDLVPVAPAAHYTIGGVKTGLMAETNIHGLFACGEVACTGVHGANRLASNSLLECIVFAKRAVDAAIEEDLEAVNIDYPKYVQSSLMLFPSPNSEREAFWKTRNNICRLMSRCVGIVRNEESLNDALFEFKKFSESVKELSGNQRLKLENMIQVASLIARSALVRKESRGAHIREDFPNEEELWKAHIVWKNDQSSIA